MISFETTSLSSLPASLSLFSFHPYTCSLTYSLTVKSVFTHLLAARSLAHLLLIHTLTCSHTHLCSLAHTLTHLHAAASLAHSSSIYWLVYTGRWSKCRRAAVSWTAAPVCAVAGDRKSVSRLQRIRTLL